MSDPNQGSLGLPDRDVGTWTRTCQECSSKSTKFKEPKGEPSNAYIYAKCKHCKSAALDYGSLVFVKPWTEGEDG